MIRAFTKLSDDLGWLFNRCRSFGLDDVEAYLATVLLAMSAVVGTLGVVTLLASMIAAALVGAP